ncbi:hypothetical protein A2U01_0083099, partial [Trifolium medium]|nr:hypothetical protein [Trifolium medium]
PPDSLVCNIHPVRSLDSFNSSLKAFWLREPTVTKVTVPMRSVTENRKVARLP